MNYPIPINISLFDFFTKGILDIIKIGQTKEYILNNFPKPKNISGNIMANQNSIWLYSTLEFHFDGDQLFLIWCDDLYSLENLEEIKFDKEILDDNKSTTLGNMLKFLSNLELDYSIKHKNKYSTTLTIEQSRVQLHFEDIEESEIKISVYDRPLIAFGLSFSHSKVI